MLTHSYETDELSPRYRVQLQLQPVQPNIYEVWDIDTPPARSILINEPKQRREREPSIRVRSPRLVNIQSWSDNDNDNDNDNDDDDDESDTDHHILYARYPRCTAESRNVRMIHVTHDHNTIRY
jgi:hypothetical protein